MDGGNIAGSVAKKRIPRSVVTAKEESERIDKEYADYLRAIADRASLSAYALEKRIGLDRKAALRVWNYEKDRHGRTPSYASAARVREAMRKALPEVEIAPPSVAVTDGEHFEWMEAGAHLRAVRPEAFRHLLETAKALSKRAGALDELTGYLIDTLGQLATRVSASRDTDRASADERSDVE